MYDYVLTDPVAVSDFVCVFVWASKRTYVLFSSIREYTQIISDLIVLFPADCATKETMTFGTDNNDEKHV